MYYVPSVLVQLGAFAVAAFLLTRDRLAAALLGGGAALQLLASIISFSTTAWVTAQAYETTMADRALIMGALGVLASLVRALGEVGIIAAAVVAARGSRGKPGVDPYGYRE